VEHQKGCDLLFEALIRCHRELPRLRAVLLGQVTQSFAAKHDSFVRQAAAWVWHPGAVAQQKVARWMAEADLLVLPSRSETFGRVIAEAQLRGLPVLATRVGALPEIVEDGATGRLVAPEDADALADAILALAADPAARRAMSREAEKQASARFDFWAVMHRQILVYQAVIEQRSPAPLLERDNGCAQAE
jgi:glycosyltransferase involved in cell wall biosynthesis